MQGNTVCHTCKSITFVIICSYIPRNVILEDRQPKSYGRWMQALPGTTSSTRYLEIVCKPYVFKCDAALRCLHQLSNNNFRTSIFVLSFVYRQFYSIAFMPSIFTGSTANAIFSEIQNMFFFANQQAPISLIHTATLRCTNLLPSSRRISGCDIPVLRSKAALWSRS